MTAQALLAISYRDFLKFVRDPVRLIWSFLFPVLLIGVFGGIMEANLGANTDFDFLAFTFTGVFAQTIFMSAAEGVVSLIDDRESDFSQEIFVSPVSRYVIVLGKIIGEASVAMPPGLAVLGFGLLFGLNLSPTIMFQLAVAGTLAAFLGGAFGVALLSNFSSRRTASQVVPFFMFPQFFLAGVFTPIRVLPWYLEVLSRLSPMRYAVDLARGVFFAGRPDAEQIVLASPAVNLAVMVGIFGLMLIVGTYRFVRQEQNR
jgi:ABC-2 type transport system permease protein